MLSFLNELENYPLNHLYEIIDIYFIRDHNGKELIKGQDRTMILQFISDWLQPSATAWRENNPIQAIRDRVGFTTKAYLGEDIIRQIFGDHINVSTGIINDFANYPMRNAFGYNPWDLLQGYISAENRDEYFRRITNVDSSKFLNNTEKIFYLTRGYGRPNTHISMKDIQLRFFYRDAEPTALLALMDFFQICPTRQIPQVVREHFSIVDLRSIDRFHYNAVLKITECLRGDSVCNAQGCNPEKIACFERFLNSIGVLSSYEYDPKTNAFISNLSQLGLYEPVIPVRKWNYEEIVSQSDPYIKGILKTLPDEQLILISTPSGDKLADHIDFTILRNRLRSNLLRESILFLTKKQYFLESNEDSYLIAYGRRADSSQQKMRPERLIDSIIRSGFLIDPYDNIIAPEEALIINSHLQNSKIQMIIDMTNSLSLQNKRLIESMTEKQRADLRTALREESSKVILNLTDLQTLIENGPPEASQLILWTCRDEWIPIALSFNDYFNYWQPRMKKNILDTLKYYQAIL